MPSTKKWKIRGWKVHVERVDDKWFRVGQFGNLFYHEQIDPNEDKTIGRRQIQCFIVRAESWWGSLNVARAKEK